MRLPATLATVLLSSAVLAEPSVLTVYTYSSFTADWGPGPAVETAFESACDCDLEFVAVDDGVALLGRVRLEGQRSDADVVLGLDTNLMAEAADTGLFAPHAIDLAHLAIPIQWESDTFVPYDYGYFAFVHDTRRLETPPASMDELIHGPADNQILIQDPRTSTPGLGLLLWMKKLHGEENASAWEALQPRVLTVTKGWSEAYGLFLEGEAPLVLSYTTSPAYHRIAEGESHYAAAPFAEGHYLQVEVAGVLASTDQPELARDFLRFMVSEDFQREIPTGNWMYPVIELEAGLPEGFPEPVPASDTLFFPPEVVAENRRAWVDEWLRAMSE